MDTTAEHGVYDEENRKKGVSNAEELEKVLRPLLLGEINKEIISINWIKTDWVGEARVIAFDPDLVIIHRSSFFHPLNAELGFGYPPFTNNPAEEQKKWDALYRVADAMLIGFLGNIATASPRTKFVVYSRGTDTNWFSAEYESNWVSDAAARIPALKGRLNAMLIPTPPGTFKDEATAEQMRSFVKAILGLPDKRESGKPNSQKTK